MQVKCQLASQFSCSVISDSLQPRGLQHTRPPCPSPNPRVYSNSCPLSWWCHPTISTSVIPFSSHLLSFPASGSLPMSWLFVSGGQSNGASAAASVLPVNIQVGIDWFDHLQSRELLRVFSSTTIQKHQFVDWHPAFFMVQLSYLYMTSGKIIALTIWTFLCFFINCLGLS